MYRHHEIRGRLAVKVQMQIRPSFHAGLMQNQYCPMHGVYKATGLSSSQSLVLVPNAHHVW